MNFDPARPRYTFPFAGTDYDLLGTMELIEAVEFALKRGITQITVDVMNGMPTHELVRVLSAVLTAGGHKTPPAEVADTLWSKVGVGGEENQLLRIHLYSFLSICLAAPEKREARAKAAGELIGKLPKASPGENSSNSA
jgi:hypothetical protein